MPTTSYLSLLNCRTLDSKWGSHSWVMVSLSHFRKSAAIHHTIAFTLTCTYSARKANTSAMRGGQLHLS